MAMQFLRRAQQLKILDAADETAAILRSPAFTRYLPALESVGFDALAFADELSAIASRGRAAYTERASAQDGWEGETADVRDLVVAFEEWVRKLHAAARAIEVTDHPVANKIDKALKLSTFDGGSAENIHGNGPNLVLNLERLGDLSELGIPKDFAERGRAILAQMPDQRAEVASGGAGRQGHTIDLHKHLDAIVDHMERYERFREFAMAMSDTEIPGLGLAAVRANVAPRRASPPEPEPTPLVSAPIDTAVGL